MAIVSIVLVVVSVIVVWNLGIEEVADVAVDEDFPQRGEGATPRAEEERQREPSRGWGVTRVAEVTQRSYFNKFFVTSSMLMMVMMAVVRVLLSVEFDSRR